VKQRLIVRPEAELDVSEAAGWYEHERPGLGHRFLDELGELLVRIESSPLQFPEIEKGVRRGLLRRFPYGVYFVVGSRYSSSRRPPSPQETRYLEKPKVVSQPRVSMGLDNTRLQRTIRPGIFELQRLGLLAAERPWLDGHHVEGVDCFHAYDDRGGG